MGNCHTDGDACGATFLFGGGRNSGDHCSQRVPPDSPEKCTVSTSFYPTISIRSANVEKMPRDAVMYDSIIYSSSDYPPTNSYETRNTGVDSNAADCGKLVGGSGACVNVWEYVPTELSFGYMESDTFFAYIYDSGINGGTIGTPCYYLEIENYSKTGGGAGGTPTSSSSSSSTKCTPCTEFSCTPKKMTCTYTYNGRAETTDPDCPYPYVFGIGTDSKKIVVSYDQLSSQVPNGVLDVSFVYAPDGIDQDVWDANNYGGDSVVTSENHWQQSDANFQNFLVYEGSATAVGDAFGLVVKVKIQPEVDLTTDPVTITGTRWDFTELLEPGSGYSAGDTVTLEYVHTHQDNTQSTFSIDLKVSQVGNIPTVGDSGGFDVLAAGDTLNGHTVINTLHTDVDNFAYHIIWLDGNGNNFTKDTQYTSSRNHIVTTHAGYGIKDRAFFGGFFEFTEKSVQFTTHDIDSASPDVYNTIKQPECTVNISNGRISSIDIDDGGENWDKLGDTPELVVTPPTIVTGKPGEIKGNFSGGVLTSIDIIKAGSGYSASNPPQVYVKNTYKKLTYPVNPSSPSTLQEINNLYKADGFNLLDQVISDNPNLSEQDAGVNAAYTAETTAHNSTFNKDQVRNVTYELPQSKYSPDKIREIENITNLYSVTYTDTSNLSSEYLSATRNMFDSFNQGIKDAYGNLKAAEVPESLTYDDALVQTTQRRFVDLPKASRFTKYQIKQYRADPRATCEFQIELSCEVLEEGCEHIECSPPLGTSPFTQTDPETEETEEWSYLPILGVKGPGCQNWTARGTMKVFHNITKAADTFVRSVRAYGNPFVN